MRLKRVCSWEALDGLISSGYLWKIHFLCVLQLQTTQWRSQPDMNTEQPVACRGNNGMGGGGVRKVRFLSMTRCVALVETGESETAIACSDPEEP